MLTFLLCLAVLPFAIGGLLFLLKLIILAIIAINLLLLTQITEIINLYITAKGRLKVFFQTAS